MSNRPAWKYHHAALCLIPALTLLSALFLSHPWAAAEAQKPGLVWLDYEAGLAKAAKEKKLIFVDFYTAWCRDCKKMDKTTFSDPDVAGKLRDGFVAVKVDAGQRKDLSSRFGLFGYPTLSVLKPTGSLAFQRTGYMDKDEFLVFLDYGLTGAYKDKDFMEYCKSKKK